MKTLSIEELKEKLNYTDLRSIRRWCQKNDVLISKQGGLEFVYETSFEEVIERPFINRLKREFGKEWESVYRLHKEGNIPALNMLHDVPGITFKTYNPANETVDKLQQKLDAYAKKKAA